MVVFVFGPSWVYALTPSVVIYVKNPCGAVTVALLCQSIQEKFYRIMRVHCVPDSCIRFFIQIQLRSLHMMGQFQNHVVARRVSHCDDSLHDCFLALCRCVFRLVGVHHALYCNYYQNWIMGVCVSTVIIVIFVIQTLEQHTAFLVLTYTCFVYWLQY